MLTFATIVIAIILVCVYPGAGLLALFISALIFWPGTMILIIIAALAVAGWSVYLWREWPENH